MVTRFCYYGNREGAESSVADTSGSERRQEECTLLIKKKIFRSLCSSCSACPVPSGTVVLLIDPSHPPHTQSYGPSAKHPSGHAFFLFYFSSTSYSTKAYTEAQDYILHFSSVSVVYKTGYCSSPATAVEMPLIASAKTSIRQDILDIKKRKKYTLDSSFYTSYRSYISYI